MDKIEKIDNDNMDTKKRFETFTVTIAKIHHHVQKIKALEMEEYPGLKGNAVMCIFILHNHPEGLTITELAAKCSEDKAAVSRSISNMEKHGYVAGEMPAGKNYRNKLRLTHKGIVCAENISKRIESAVTGGGNSLTWEEREVFYDCLLRISDSLGIKFKTICCLLYTSDAADE